MSLYRWRDVGRRMLLRLHVGRWLRPELRMRLWGDVVRLMRCGHELLLRRDVTRRRGARVPVIPVVATTVERAIAVVAVPIRPRRVANDRQADAWPIAIDRDLPTLVQVIQMTRVRPAADRPGTDIAPVVAVDAAVHVDTGPGRKPRDLRVATIRPGPACPSPLRRTNSRRSASRLPARR